MSDHEIPSKMPASQGNAVSVGKKNHAQCLLFTNSMLSHGWQYRTRQTTIKVIRPSVSDATIAQGN